MKSKIFTLFAAFTLLFGARAMAQVDGDEQNIVVTINAMQEAGGIAGETMYWYVGQTKPSSMDTAPSVDDTNFLEGIDVWHTLVGNKIAKSVKGGAADLPWYIAVPTAKNFSPMQQMTAEVDGEITIEGISYTIWKTEASKRRNIYMQGGKDSNIPLMECDVNKDDEVDVADITAHVSAILAKNENEETTYYWYAGQERPVSMTIAPNPDDVNYTNNQWHTLADGINEYVGSTFLSKTVLGGTSGYNWYIAVPTSKKFIPTASDLYTPNSSWDIVGTITIDNVNYTVWCSNSTGTRSSVYMSQVISDSNHIKYK